MHDPGHRTRASEAATTWGVGEYELMAERLRPAAAELIELANVDSRDRVLDIACGTGNAALIAAARADKVLAVDFEPELLAIARTRAKSSGLTVDWVCADALSPELPERAFSVVLSAFGVMYVPDQTAAAAALARASAPGARIALASWTPGSFMPAMGSALGAYLPPPPAGSAPPSRWGDEAAVGELLGRHAIEIRVASRSSLSLSFGDRAEAVAFLIRTAGNVLAERARLERDGRWRDLERDLVKLVRDRDEDADDGVQLECEYLLVLADAPARPRAVRCSDVSK